MKDAKRPPVVMSVREAEAAYEALPQGTPAAILDGELRLLPRPRLAHSRVATSVNGQLYGPFDLGPNGPGGWVILFEPELHLGPRPDKLAPDVAGWRRERLPELPETAAIALAPDWICEVLSPGGERIDRIEKARIYAREGVRHYWIIDPVAKTLEVLRNEGGLWLQPSSFAADAGAALVRAEPFDAIELNLAALFRR
jgi:Uma2 family endonuclease